MTQNQIKERVNKIYQESDNLMSELQKIRRCCKHEYGESFSGIKECKYCKLQILVE